MSVSVLPMCYVCMQLAIVTFQARGLKTRGPISGRVVDWVLRKTKLKTLGK